MNIDFFFGREKTSSVQVPNQYAHIPVRIPGRDRMLAICFSLPVLDMQGYWIPSCRVPSSKLDWVIESDSGSQRNFPFLTFFNSRQENRVAVALDNLYDDVKITAKMNQQNCTYDMTIQVAINQDTSDFNLVLDRRPQLWTKSLGEWFKFLELPETSFPGEAWNPVFCTWYVVHGAVTGEWVERTAKLASELGFGTLIIDDGWSYDEMKRVSPETISTWYDTIGDWQLSEQKFPDFAAHVKRVQDMGMQYLLWVAPFLIGVNSGIAEYLSNAVFPEYTEGCHTFDPRNRKEAQILLYKLSALMENYPIDGLKVDFLDFVPPDVNNPRGRDTLDFIQKLSGRIRAVKQNALIEFRQHYATPQMLAYGTQFRAGDVPFDYTDNFARLAQIRIGIGDGVPVHADPLYWHPEESPVNIARHLIASLAGVPMLSVDLEKITPLEKEIISCWIRFYHDHRELFQNGHWDVGYHRSGVSWMMVSGDGESILILQDDARLDQALKKTSGKVWILNLSPEELELPDKVETFDYAGHKGRPGKVRCGGMGVLA